MNKMVLVIALAAIALTSVSAFAQVDPAYQNNIGIYTDEAGTNDCAIAPIGPLAGYLVLNKLTSTEVLGWEVKLTTDAGGLYLTGVAPRGQAVNVGTRTGEQIVGLASPLPAVGNSVVVADLQMLVATTAPGNIFAGPIYFSLLENGLPAYLDGDSNGFSLHPSHGDTDVAIFTVNGDCGPVAVEDASFGSVKSLFR